MCIRTHVEDCQAKRFLFVLESFDGVMKVLFAQCIKPQNLRDFAVEGTLEEELEPCEVGGATIMRMEVLLQKSQLLLELLEVEVLQDNIDRSEDEEQHLEAARGFQIPHR